MTLHQIACDMGLVLAAAAAVDLGDERDCLALLAVSRAGLAPIFTLAQVNEHFDQALEFARAVRQTKQQADLRSAA